MAKVAIVHHSGFGHTRVQAEAVHRGASRVKNVDAVLIAIEEYEAHWEALDRHGDSARLSRVFHPQAHYVCPTEEVLVYRTMAEYFPIVDARPSPASRGDSRHDRIVSIELGGPAFAFVRAECSIGPKFFTDFLTLIRTDGRWQIISKVFHFDLPS